MATIPDMPQLPRPSNVTEADALAVWNQFHLKLEQSGTKPDLGEIVLAVVRPRHDLDRTLRPNLHKYVSDCLAAKK